MDRPKGPLRWFRPKTESIKCLGDASGYLTNRGSRTRKRMITQTFKDEVDKLKNYEDCREAFDLIRHRMSYLDSIAGMEFSVGQTVSFPAKHGKTLTGTITKINRKTVNVDTSMGNWRVAPSLLTVVKTDKEKANA